MSSLYNKRGIRKKVDIGTKRSVELKVNSSIYRDHFIKVGQTSKNVMLSILKYMDDDTNLISIGGETLERLSEHTGYTKQVVRDNLRLLNPMLEKTHIRGTYIVNPVFAVKGNEDNVWKVYIEIEAKLQEKEYEEE